MSPSPQERSALQTLRETVHRLANPARAAILRRFFKTDPGEYGEGDRFLGIQVPPLRALAREYRDLELPAVEELLQSGWHEERLLALLLLVQHFARGDDARRRLIYRTYLAHTACVNNWDLVDCSAEHIVGAYLRDRGRKPLLRLARSRILWERRIAIIATFHFIKRGELAPTLELAERLLGDPEPLIHKAVGWMLREVGKRNEPLLESFLLCYAPSMPRTMLRYAIERLEPAKRRRYLEMKSTPFHTTGAPLRHPLSQ